jgi:hypothetical protein
MPCHAPLLEIIRVSTLALYAHTSQMRQPNRTVQNCTVRRFRGLQNATLAILTSREFTLALHFVLTASSFVGACLKGASEKETVGHRVVTRFYFVSLSLAGLGRDEGPVAVAGAPRDRAKLHDPERALRAGTHDGSLISVPL